LWKVALDTRILWKVALNNIILWKVALDTIILWKVALDTIICLYAQGQKIGKLNNLKLLGVSKPKGVNEKAKIS
jgi:hypothetical protein